MPDPEWPCSTPETNYLRLAGAGAAGSATSVASAAAWQSLVAGCEMAFAASTINTAATGMNFEGVGGIGSATTATGLNAALQRLAGWVQEKPPLIADAVAAYQAAVTSMIPAEVCLANRAEQAADVAMNPLVLGALTPAIVALDAEYFGEHWPQNAGAGVAYGSALAALAAALAIPPPLSPPGASPVGPAVAAAAVAQGTGRLATQEAMTESGDVVDDAAKGVTGAPTSAGLAGQVTQFGSMLTQPLQAVAGMFRLPEALSGVTSLPQALIGPLAGAMNAAPEGEGEVPDGPEDPMPRLVPSGAVGGAGGVGGLGAPTSFMPPAGGSAGLGITSYTKPSAGFAAESGGRPVARTGLLSVAELRGPTLAASPGAMPIPAKPPSTDRKATNAVVPQARIMIDGAYPQG